jgi:hypothetical protein
MAFNIADAINYLIKNNVTIRRYHSLLLLCYASLSTLTPFPCFSMPLMVIGLVDTPMFVSRFLSLNTFREASLSSRMS